MAKVLYVDDDPGMLSAISEFLSDRGYHVTLSGSPNHALELLAPNPAQFDTIILDWKLNCAIDGDMLLSLVKHRFPDFKTPVIFLTGYTHLSAKYLIRLGAFDAISKKDDPNCLLEAIERALHKKPGENPHEFVPSYLNQANPKLRDIAKKVVPVVTSTANLTEAAAKLGCSRRHLYRLIKLLRLESILILKDRNP